MLKMTHKRHIFKSLDNETPDKAVGFCTFLRNRHWRLESAPELQMLEKYTLDGAKLRAQWPKSSLNKR